jgi:hypothetical protein
MSFLPDCSKQAITPEGQEDEQFNVTGATIWLC